MGDSEILDSADAVIDALGGTAAVARLTGRRPTAVSNWRGTHLPPNTYVVLTSALKRLGRKAPNRLWNMTEAPSPAEIEHVSRRAAS